MPELNKTVDGVAVKGSYEIENSGTININIQEPFIIHDFVVTQVDFEIDKYLTELFNLIDVIRTHKSPFEKLYDRFSDFNGLLSVQYQKRVFYSETEREAYVSDMCSRLGKEFFRLYRELIVPEVKLAYEFVLPVPKLIKQILKII